MKKSDRIDDKLAGKRGRKSWRCMPGRLELGVGGGALAVAREVSGWFHGTKLDGV